jgi:DNA-binding NtrC family response regulator
MNPQILVVDDEPRYCRILEVMLQREGYEVITTSDGQHAARHLDEHDVDVIISDLRMPQFNGAELLKHRNVVAPHVPFIVLTAFGTIESAVEMVREGALDYLTKPFQEETLLATVRNALKVRALAEENRDLKRLLSESLGETVFLGESSPVRSLMERVGKVAPTELTVLILGETGTGKDLLAHVIHKRSAHRDGPFVKVNCAAIPAALLESELFGYERGAFSGATARQKGKFQLAQGGTLFLDEIGEMDPPLQAKILHAIEEKSFYPIGGSRLLEVNCRILAASNRPLEEWVRQGRFREDLFHRLMAFPVRIPPLRERREDITLLAEHYIRRFGADMGYPGLTLDTRALDFLMDHDWPGNVRELMNVLRSAVLMSRGGIIGLQSLALHPVFWGTPPPEGENPSAASTTKPSLVPTLAEAERQILQQALQACEGNKSQAARLLGISRSHLRYRMMVHGL